MSYSGEVEFRQALRKAWCRICGNEIPIGEKMATWYSSANRGMHIHLHLKCAVELGHRAELEIRKDQTA